MQFRTAGHITVTCLTHWEEQWETSVVYFMSGGSSGKQHLVMALQHFYIMNIDTETQRKGQCGHTAGAISVPASNGSPGNLSQAAERWE